MKKVKNFIHHTFYRNLVNILKGQNLTSNFHYQVTNKLPISEFYENCIFFVPVVEDGLYSIYDKNIFYYEPENVVCALVFDDEILSYDFSFSKKMNGLCDKNRHDLSNEEFFFFLDSGYDINRIYQKDYANRISSMASLSPELLLRTPELNLHTYLRKIYIYFDQKLAPRDNMFYDLTDETLEMLIKRMEKIFMDQPLSNFIEFMVDNDLYITNAIFLEAVKKYSTIYEEFVKLYHNDPNTDFYFLEAVLHLSMLNDYKDYNIQLKPMIEFLIENNKTLEKKYYNNLKSVVEYQEEILHYRDQINLLLKEYNYNNVDVEIREAFTFKRKNGGIYSHTSHVAKKIEMEELSNIIKPCYPYNNNNPYIFSLFSFS